MKQLFVFFVKIYQKTISPFLGPHCRFHPSCSQYAIESIRAFGVVRGISKSFIRILKCQPFSLGGHDPVRA